MNSSIKRFHSKPASLALSSAFPRIAPCFASDGCVDLNSFSAIAVSYVKRLAKNQEVANHNGTGIPVRLM